jgi:hypothetical protein
MNFKQYFIESTVVLKNRLVVYDFDGTIADVPERPSDWTGSDWWGHKDSLNHPYYDGAVHQEVVSSFKSDTTDPKTDVILLTGRRGVIAHGVRNVLRTNGLHGKRVIPDSNLKAKNSHDSEIKSGLDVHVDDHSHEEYYSGDHNYEDDYPKTLKGKPDASTIAHKLYVIKNKKMNSNIEIVEFWDDREDHASEFIKLGLELIDQYGIENGGKLKKVIFHRVFQPINNGGTARIVHIPIKKGMTY